MKQNSDFIHKVPVFVNLVRGGSRPKQAGKGRQEGMDKAGKGRQEGMDEAGKGRQEGMKETRKAGSSPK